MVENANNKRDVTTCTLRTHSNKVNVETWRTRPYIVTKSAKHGNIFRVSIPIFIACRRSRAWIIRRLHRTSRSKRTIPLPHFSKVPPRHNRRLAFWNNRSELLAITYHKFCNSWLNTCLSIGVAFDGFPIYGPIDENGHKLNASVLDECNGRIDSNGNYK